MNYKWLRKVRAEAKRNVNLVVPDFGNKYYRRPKTILTIEVKNHLLKLVVRDSIKERVPDVLYLVGYTVGAKRDNDISVAADGMTQLTDVDFLTKDLCHLSQDSIARLLYNVRRAYILSRNKQKLEIRKREREYESRKDLDLELRKRFQKRIDKINKLQN